MRGSKQVVSSLPRNLLSKFRGFTIVEFVVASAILVILMSGLLMILQQGELTTGIGTAKVDLEAEVKMLVDWITKDLRQTNSVNLTNNDNDPDYTHLKFNLWVWDNATKNIIYSDSYVEYNYNSSNQTLVRGYYDASTSTTFNNAFFNITLPPFYTSYTDEIVNDFNTTDLRMEGLIIVVKKEKTVRDRPLNFTMVEKVRVRNE